MLQQKMNEVKIEGILSEIDIKETSFVKNGKTINALGGVIKIRVDQNVNGQDVVNEIPVSVFASELKNDGNPNPVYTSLKTVMETYVSIAAGGIEMADRVRITRAQITSNTYYANGENLVSYPRITGTFINRIKAEDCKPEASFEVEFMIGECGYETNAEGEETGRYRIKGIIPQYGGKVDVVPFYAVKDSVIDAVSNYWQAGDTVHVVGQLNFTSKTEIVEVPVDFGDPIQKKKTITVSDLIIIGGSSSPLEGDFALDPDEVNAALAERKARLEESKTKGKAGNASSDSRTERKSSLQFGF